ncbi:MAG: sigma-54-dependent transcriptional regulator [Bacteroidota bacterium]
MNKLNLLIVEDEAKIHKLLELNLRKTFKLMHAGNGIEAMEIIHREEIDLVLTDLKMPAMSGRELLKKIRSEVQEIPVLVITAYGSIENAVDLVREGAFDYITKPLDLDELDVALGRAARYVRILKENALLKSRIRLSQQNREFITVNPRMQEIIKHSAEIAKTNFTVLIEGETGSGKELIARGIHSLSPRKSGPFIPVNCGAIPRELLEGECFGVEKGAYTGAVASRPGKFELANNGTLFLDEISEMPLDLQVKLLRAIEEQQITRLGGRNPIMLDLKIIAATNRKLGDDVAEGKFRKDLYFRLNVINIIIPPLRERKEDIPVLAQYFLFKNQEAVGKNLKGFDPEAIELLKAYSYPGNVRELENLVIRAMVTARREFIYASDIPPEFVADAVKGQEQIPHKYSDFLLKKRELKEKVLMDIEKTFLREILNRNDWNVSRTARYSDMDRRQLQNLMKKHNLRHTGFNKTH